MISVLLTLLAAFFSGAHSLFLKTSSDRPTTLISISWFNILVGCVAVWFVPIPEQSAWPYLIGSSVFVTIQMIATQFALRDGALTTVWPIQASVRLILIVAGAAIIFNEPITLSVFGAIILVIIGVHLIQPLHLFKANKKVVFWSITFGVGLTIQIFIAAAGIQHVSNPFSYIVYDFFTVAPLLILTYAFVRPRVTLRRIYNNIAHNFLTSTSDMASYTITLYLFYITQVGQTLILKQSSLLFVLLLGVIFLKENLSKPKILAFILITAGLIINQL